MVQLSLFYIEAIFNPRTTRCCLIATYKWNSSVFKLTSVQKKMDVKIQLPEVVWLPGRLIEHVDPQRPRREYQIALEIRREDQVSSTEERSRQPAVVVGAWYMTVKVVYVCKSDDLAGSDASLHLVRSQRLAVSLP